jgi:hypothetical protein
MEDVRGNKRMGVEPRFVIVKELPGRNNHPSPRTSKRCLERESSWHPVGSRAHSQWYSVVIGGEVRREEPLQSLTKPSHRWARKRWFGGLKIRSRKGYRFESCPGHHTQQRFRPSDSLCRHDSKPNWLQDGCRVSPYPSPCVSSSKLAPSLVVCPNVAAPSRGQGRHREASSSARPAPLHES